MLPSEKLKIRIETDLFIQKMRLRNRAVFESDILAVVVRAVLEGVGVAFLSEPYIAKELRHETLIRLGTDKPFWQHPIFIMAQNTKVLDPVVEEIKNYFEILGSKS